MSGKPDINEVSLVPDCLHGKGFGKDAKLVEGRDLPDHIVAHADIVQRRIHFVNTGFHFFKSSHDTPRLS